MAENIALEINLHVSPSQVTVEGPQVGDEMMVKWLYGPHDWDWTFGWARVADLVATGLLPVADEPNAPETVVAEGLPTWAASSQNLPEGFELVPGWTSEEDDIHERVYRVNPDGDLE